MLSKLKKLRFFPRKKNSIWFTDALGQRSSYALAEGKSVLETLLQAGHEIPNSCRAGACQSCLLQCSNPETLPTVSQSGLSATQKTLGYFLSCSCFPEKEVDILALKNKGTRQQTQVISNDYLNDSIIRLRIKSPFSFRAGQFCNLYKNDSTFRSYSIASPTDADYMEFHIKVHAEGQFSAWAATQLKPGDTLEVQGPFGQCIYTPPAPEQAKPMLLSGIGTGLAPLLGVIKDALEHAHSGDIHLVLGAKNACNFYLIDELQSLSNKHPKLKTSWLASNATASTKPIETGDIYEFVKEQYPSLEQHTIYLCGAPSFIQKMKKQCFMSGAAMSAINCDIFQAAS